MERGVAIGADGLAEPHGGGLVESQRPSSAIRLGVDRARGASLAEQLANPGSGDREACGDLFTGTDTSIAGRDDSLT